MPGKLVSMPEYILMLEAAIVNLNKQLLEEEKAKGRSWRSWWAALVENARLHEALRAERATREEAERDNLKLRPRLENWQSPQTCKCGRISYDVFCKCGQQLF